MITKVAVTNIRGVTTDIELANRTIITGPNGIGKSAIAVGIDIVLLGLVPGYGKKEVFDNASGDVMGGRVEIDGHSVRRTLEQGKKLQERITIDDGTPAAPAAAAPMLEVLLGKRPRLLNMPAFWDAAPAERRRMLLRLVADAETQKQLAVNEAQARAKKNEATAKRQGSDKALEQLTASLSEIDRPTGNLDSLRAERETVKKDLKNVRDAIRIGEANARARAYSDKLTEALPKLAELVKNLEADEQKQRTIIKESREAIAALEKPVSPPQSFGFLPDESRVVVATVVQNLNNIAKDVPQDTRTAIALYAEIERLETLLPEAEDSLAFAREKEVSDAAVYELEASLTEAEIALENAVDALSMRRGGLADATRAKAEYDAIGAGVEKNDYAARDGLEIRERELDAKIEPLEKIATLEAELEKARLSAEEALELATAAKDELATAEKAQQSVLMQAADQLASRSRAVLPQGELRFADDGKGVTISWAKDDKVRVPRTTLSGGEQALFDCALGHSMAPEALVVVEGAELDEKNLIATMEHIADCKYQVLLLTCHEPSRVPDGWSHLQLRTPVGA